LIYKAKDNISKFLTHKFILCGRVFLPLRPKDGKVYLVKVSEDFDRLPLDFESDHRRLTFREIVSWHNPMENNSKQVNVAFVLLPFVAYGSAAYSKVGCSF
jgi:hypothetical protein